MLPAILLGSGIVSGVYGIFLFNSLITARNRQRKAFSQIDVQLQRRHDLVPNLVETARATMTHERTTLEAVLAARNEAERARYEASIAGAAHAVKILNHAEGQLMALMAQFSGLMESYPTLQSDRTMLGLMEELRTTENRVAFARQAYNDAVMRYNNRLETMPGSLLAGWLRFTPGQLFEISNEQERLPVEVSFPMRHS